ncbi:Geranylgeranyl pyrophosphate synthase D [Diaporthe amygdali]|uniref:Geranylgeranyl pyrophosphate synthase D n=1 Tax=Phomopsis amygdali TaxID=1214568 RepID=UPI0022FDDAED|nr:Geranylgeranyl pyrophosphate synthase D [Diaporthe amygdali]KAJ0109428.1 Geranylgeranyl pyrophosphate synthase D [Diaporthe amygdali]
MQTDTRPSAPWPSLPKVHKRNRSTSLSDQQTAKKAHVNHARLHLPQPIEPVYESQNGSVSQSEEKSSAVEINNSAAGDPQRFAVADLNFSWAEEEEKVVLAPYDYVASNSGKEFRTLILNAFNAWFRVPPESLTIICDVVRMLHTSSLLIDDIQDNSLLRRGRPVAHSIYGVAQTINTGNYVYFLAAKELNKLRNAASALEVFTAEMLNLHRGQGQELYWRDTLKCPTEDEYLKMVSNKTGGLFRMAVKLMQAESPAGPMAPVCDKLVQLLGLVYQIADDYKNLTAVEYTTSKGFCEDLTEGKFSFPVVHSIQSRPEDRRLYQILAQKTTEVEVKKYAVSYIESTGSLEYTKQVVRVLVQRARDELSRIDQGRERNQEMHALLGKMALE